MCLSDLFYSLFQDEMGYGLGKLHWLVSIDQGETGVTSSEIGVCSCVNPILLVIHRL